MNQPKYKVGQIVYYGPFFTETGKESYNKCQVISCDNETVCYMLEDSRQIPIIEFAEVDDCYLLTVEMYEKQQSKRIS